MGLSLTWKELPVIRPVHQLSLGEPQSVCPPCGNGTDWSLQFLDWRTPSNPYSYGVIRLQCGVCSAIQYRRPLNWEEYLDGAE
jgi:hypothetical protein